MPPSPRNAPAAERLAAAVAVAAAAFLLYHATLLPGLDFGDTGAFQTMAGSRFITPRDGYPLYFAIADVIAAFIRASPAYAFNLVSAIEAAVACGLIVLVGVELSGSIAAAVASTLLFAVSYTFWSQAVIAEVYALHIALVALTLLLLLRWSNRPTTARLGVFFAVYALAFGNHLSMILLLPAYAIFLGRSVLSRRVIVLASACAIGGALQYAWNIRTLWFLAQPPHGMVDALRQFWFDVTKSDWRDTMVLNVPESMFRDHAAMYWFDLRQQFGVVGPLVAAVGLVHLAAVNQRRAVLMALLFTCNVAFAYSYNVGDAHVFYLPSHLIVALLMSVGLVAAKRLAPGAALCAATFLALYAAARGFRDYPALDRSADRRPSQLLNALTQGLDDRQNVFVTDLNWQIQNGLSVFTHFDRREIAVVSMPNVALYLPALAEDNRAIGRTLVLTERAAAAARASFGPLLPIADDSAVRAGSLSDTVAALPPNTRYALCVLKPSRDLSLDVDELKRTLGFLAIDRTPTADYFALVGTTGHAPSLLEESNLPFSRGVQLDGMRVEVRMESWLSADTIRRMGFGHVIVGRQHTLIVERGVSFVAFDDHGKPINTAYASNIFAPQRRFLLR